MKLIISIIFFSLLPSCQNTKHKNKIETKTYISGTHFISDAKQITFKGHRSNEGSFNTSGDKMIFQSERKDSNPFLQTYIRNLETGKVWPVSPGKGKTSSPSFHPIADKVIFASTHHDRKAIKKQKDEFKTRKSGKKKRYYSNYDQEYEIYSSTSKGNQLKNLTNTLGYDAEGSYSPDGTKIVFASNRSAYLKSISPEEKKSFEKNPAVMMDIYIMDSNGQNVKQLTTQKGYDGEPVFSPNGKRIAWKRSSQDGHQSEIFSMNTDGSDKRQLTQHQAISWAPNYHPSGDYIIYTTSIHGHYNFELYAIDSKGENNPVRVTNSSGYDGPATFSPDGEHISWTKNLADRQSQLFLGQWNDELIRKHLKLSPRKSFVHKGMFNPNIKYRDIKKLIYHFASEEMKGRKTGTPEETLYTKQVANLFKQFNLIPYGENKTYFQSFDFVSEVMLGKKNILNLSKNNDSTFPKLNTDWIPLAFSKSGTFTANDVIFAGYGIVAPATEKLKQYNSYKNINVKNKWVMVLRYSPEELEGEKRKQLQPYSRIYSKVMAAYVRGAKGIIFVTGPNTDVKSELIKFGSNDLKTTGNLPAISLSTDLATNLIPNFNLKEIQTSLDKGNIIEKEYSSHGKLKVDIEITQNTSKGRNVLGLLKVPGAKKTLIIGAHGDHIGKGKSSSSLMNSSDETDIHFGADDNASGMAGVIELAHYFSTLKENTPSSLKQNILFVIWSGEEIGILGSNHFRKFNSKTNKKRKRSLRKKYSAYLNMDMIGRLEKNLSIQGVGSSKRWPSLIEKLSYQFEVPLVTAEDPYLPTDAMALYTGGLPILSFFTGAHGDYHSPRDTPESINYRGTKEVIELVQSFALEIVKSPRSIPYNQVTQKNNKRSKSASFRVSLGTIPDYSQGKVKGVLLSGVVKNGAAAKAGLKAGDTILSIGDYKTSNIYDFVAALQSLRPNKSTSIIIKRNGKEKKLQITPQAKE